MRMRLTLQGKLLLTLLGAVVLAVGVTILTILGLLAWFMSRESGDLFQALGQLPAVEARAQAVGRALAADPTPDALREAALTPGLPTGSRVQVVDMRGTLWVDTAGEAGGVVAPGEVLTWLLTGQDAGLASILTEPIQVSGQLWGYYVYRPPGWESPPAAGTGQEMQQLSGWALIIGQSFVLLVSLLLFLGFGRHLVRPVRRLSAVVRRIADGDLSARASLNPRQDELGLLARDVDRMAERLQEAQERAASAEEARRYTVATVSHDLRTPLTALLAHAEAVRTGVTDDVDRSLVVVQEKGLQMKGLIDDLFELASLDADHGPWKTRRVDVSEVVRVAVAGMLPQLEAAGMSVDPNIPDETLPADLPSGKLERVLDNLLSNALKYGASGGWLGVRVGRREGTIRIAVADRGPGIPVEEQRRIFDPFYRADQARSGRQRGSGLGLAVAARIVERLGGRTGVESPSEGGACFWVELPAADEALRQDHCSTPA